jgi:hypothetical protein
VDHGQIMQDAKNISWIQCMNNAISMQHTATYTTNNTTRGKKIQGYIRHESEVFH